MDERDQRLEAEINRQCDLVAASETKEQLAERFKHMRLLIAQRSPAQIERMEQARGLR